MAETVAGSRFRISQQFKTTVEPAASSRSGRWEIPAEEKLLYQEHPGVSVPVAASSTVNKDMTAGLLRHRKSPQTGRKWQTGACETGRQNFSWCVGSQAGE